MGAGKTTFLKEVLKKPELKSEQLLLMVNDYGLENYDGQELNLESIELIEITNGCLCCSYKNQFEELLAECATRTDIDRIFIEPSGLFFPDQVLTAFEKEPIKSFMTVEPIVTIVDYALLSGKKAWPPTIERLIEAGQLIVRNKIDRITPEELQIVENRITQLNNQGLHDFDEAVNKFLDFKSVEKRFSRHIENKELDHGVSFVQKTEGLQFKDSDELMLFLTEQNPDLIRAKGNVLLDGRLTYINFVNEDLKIGSVPNERNIGLSCFYEQVSV